MCGGRNDLYRQRNILGSDTQYQVKQQKIRGVNITHDVEGRACMRERRQRKGNRRSGKVDKQSIGNRVSLKRDVLRFKPESWR